MGSMEYAAMNSLLVPHNKGDTESNLSYSTADSNQVHCMLRTSDLARSGVEVYIVFDGKHKTSVSIAVVCGENIISQ